MSFKKYNGQDKYHFRIYKRSVLHPFIVVAVSENIEENGEITISGYIVTHSLNRVFNKPGVYEKLKKNPNPNDSKPSFVNRYRVNDIPANRFSKPYTRWHLAKEDEELIDKFEQKYRNKKKAP